jgi:hypothetical protein
MKKKKQLYLLGETENARGQSESSYQAVGELLSKS